MLLTELTSLYKLRVNKITPLIKKALDYATEKHEGQTRKFSGKPYIVHPIAVAELINKYSAFDKYEDLVAASRYMCLDDKHIYLNIYYLGMLAIFTFPIKYLTFFNLWYSSVVIL